MVAVSPIPTSTGKRTVRPTSVWQHFFQILRFGFALLGLGVLLTALLLGAQPDVRRSAEGRLIGWLQQRQAPLSASLEAPVDEDASAEVSIDKASEARPVAAQPVAAAGMPVLTAADDRAVSKPVAGADVADTQSVTETNADETVLAADPETLPRAQAKVAYWLSKKYRVAPEPLSVLVAEAWEVGKRERIDWTLILAVMAVESSFNPFAQSSVGAQGLMQVMTRIHGDKYDSAGGKLAAFDPVTNLRVGVKVLLECIERAGSLEAGLKYYVGAANLASDNGYSKRVLAERARLKQVAAGRAVS